MLVVSSSLVLSTVAADAPNNNNPLVGWHNLVTVGNIETTTELDGFPALNLANPSTCLFWQGNGDSSPAEDEYIAVNLDEVDPIDYVGIAGHNFGTAQITVSVEGLTGPEDSPPTWTEIVQEFIPADDVPLMARFVPQSLAGIRIRLQPGLEAPRAAVLYVGRLLVLPRRIYVGHQPITFNTTSNVITGRAELGQFLGRIVLSETTVTQLSLQNILASFYRSDMEPWRLASIARPFFFAWRPGTYPYEIGYCWATGDMRVENQRTNGMVKVSLSVQGISK